MSASQIKIECNKEHIKINDLEIRFPTHLNILKEVFGDPSKQEHDLSWRVVWDDIGIYTDYGTSNNILKVNFLVSNDHKLKHFPKKLFSGQIKVNNHDINDNNFKEFDLKKHKVKILTYKGNAKPYSISIGKNFNYKEEIPKDKYLLKDLDEEQIEFGDFGFKLAIIQELMYNKELLKPKFDLYEFAEWYDKRKIIIEKEGYKPIPEVTQYFKDLQVPKKLAPEITEISQDGGNNIYSQLLRFGEGFEDYWDIKTAIDAKEFPNLKKVVLSYAKENVINEFNKMGIKAKWL